MRLSNSNSIFSLWPLVKRFMNFFQEKYFLLLLMIFVSACAAEGTSTNGALFISSTPSGAEVLLNGKLQGRTPLTVRELEPGDYEVVLRKDGYQDVSIAVSVKPRLTSAIAGTLRADPAPLRHRLAYISNREGAYDVWFKDEGSDNATRWTSLALPRPPLAAALAPDGNFMALSVESPGGVATWIVTAPQPHSDEGSTEARTVRGDIFRLLQWSPDSRSLLLKNLVSQTIWLGTLSGNVNQILIPDVPRGVLTAAFVPEGGSIAYVDHDKTWLIGLDGTRRQELALNGAAGNTYLRYSRDGRRLAHVRMQRSNIFGAGELWLMNANGSLPRRLSLLGSQDFEPVWSRDGQKIVFVHRENVQETWADEDVVRLVSNLWVIDLASQTLQPLTAFRGKHVRQPSIAPDDQTATFVANQTGYDEIWSVDLNGGEPHPLTHDKASAGFPLWLW